MQTDMNAVVLPDGTRLGRVEAWADDPDIFDGWLESETETDRLVANGAERSLAVVELVRVYLVREIKLQEQAGSSDPAYAARTGRIMHAFRMYRETTVEHLDIVRKRMESGETG